MLLNFPHSSARSMSTSCRNRTSGPMTHSIPSASENVILALTRNVVGGMHSPQLGFSMAYQQHHTLYGHTLALTVVFETPFISLAGRADSNGMHGFRHLFKEFPFIRDFLRNLPTVWDDTVLLSADPSTHVIVARRFERDWWIAGITTAHLDQATKSLLASWEIPWEKLFPAQEKLNCSYSIITSHTAPQQLIERTGFLILQPATIYGLNVTQETASLPIPPMREGDGFVVHLQPTGGHLQQAQTENFTVLSKEGGVLHTIARRRQEPAPVPKVQGAPWSWVPLAVLGVALLIAAALACTSTHKAST